MSFVKNSLGPTEIVLGTVPKKLVTVSLGSGAISALRWSEDEPNLAAALGDGEDAGWLRLCPDEEGLTPTEVEGRLQLSLPRSAVPDLEPCRASPLTWRSVDGGIEIRLPTVASSAPAARPHLRAVGGRSAAPVEPDDRPEVIGPPALYAQLHRDAWAAGIEVHFLSNGDCVVNGKIVDIDEVESAVRRAGERRSTDVSRAS